MTIFALRLISLFQVCKDSTVGIGVVTDAHIFLYFLSDFCPKLIEPDFPALKECAIGVRRKVNAPHFTTERTLF